MELQGVLAAVAELSIGLALGEGEEFAGRLMGWDFRAYRVRGRTMAQVGSISTPLDCQAAVAARRALNSHGASRQRALTDGNLPGNVAHDARGAPPDGFEPRARRWSGQ